MSLQFIYPKKNASVGIYAMSFLDLYVIGTPSIVIVPESGLTRPAMIFISVDFPLPFGPSSAYMCPGSISSDRSDMAVVVIYFLTRCSHFNIVSFPFFFIPSCFFPFFLFIYFPKCSFSNSRISFCENPIPVSCSSKLCIISSVLSFFKSSMTLSSSVTNVPIPRLV